MKTYFLERKRHNYQKRTLGKSVFQCSLNFHRVYNWWASPQQRKHYHSSISVVPTVLLLYSAYQVILFIHDQSPMYSATVCSELCSKMSLWGEWTKTNQHNRIRLHNSSWHRTSHWDVCNFRRVPPPTGGDALSTFKVYVCFRLVLKDTISHMPTPVASLKLCVVWALMPTYFWSPEGSRLGTQIRETDYAHIRAQLWPTRRR